MEKSINKTAYLDGIRGVAALFVLFHHFLLAFYTANVTFDTHASHIHNFELLYGQSVFSFLSNGHFCVCIFFVLSGFVLSRKYFQTRKFEVLISGTCRRFLRLYIPVATTIIISFILLETGLYYNVPAAKLAHSEWWFGNLWTFPHHLQRLWTCLRVSTMFQGDNAFDTSLWTMSIEFTGSLLVFAFLALTHDTRNRLLSLLILLVFCQVIYNRPMAAFVLGISLNYIEQSITIFNKKRLTIAAVLLLTVGLIFGSFPSTFDIRNTIFRYGAPIFLKGAEWIHIAGAYFVMIAFIISPRLQRFISYRIFRFLGYISFSLYLLHPLIIGSFSSYLLLHMYPSMGYNKALLYIFLLTTSICLTLSWLMAKYIDNPGVVFSKYVYNRWFRNTGQ